jgi:hypothetical protein
MQAMYRRSFVAMSYATAILPVAWRASAAPTPRPASIDEALGMLEEDALVQLVEQSLTPLGINDLWVVQYKRFVDAGTRAGYRLAALRGRKVDLDTLVASQGLNLLVHAAEDGRLEPDIREKCRRYLISHPGFKEGRPFCKQPQTAKDLHGYCCMAVQRQLYTLAYGTPSDILTGTVDWDGLGKAWTTAHRNHKNCRVWMPCVGDREARGVRALLG